MVGADLRAGIGTGEGQPMKQPQREFSLIRLVIFVATLAFASPLHAESQAPAGKTLSAAQLEQLVAPIALYPDDLLSQVLMASTYPLEVVEAARWSRDNPKVTGQALEDAPATHSDRPALHDLAGLLDHDCCPLTRTSAYNTSGSGLCPHIATPECP